MKSSIKLTFISSLFSAYVLKTLLLLSLSTAVHAGSCDLPDAAVLHSVKRVIDADTLELADGQRVRLIGVDAPELGYRGQADEPFAREGKQALEEQLRHVGWQLWVASGEDAQDRYGRLLADLFLPDQRSLQAWLLEQGWVMQVHVPPNLRYADCYRVAEASARKARLGIWSLPAYEPGIASTQIPEGTRGAVILHGAVVRIGQSQANIWLNLEGGVAIQIPRDALHRFSEPLEDLQGQTLRVRGWLIPEETRHHQWRIRVEDGRALERL